MDKPQGKKPVDSKIPGKKSLFPKSLLVLFLLFLIVGAFYIAKYKVFEFGNIWRNKIKQEKTTGMMILIEYKDTVGLVNFVNELQKRNIPGVLHVSADFVEDNCDTIKGLLQYDMEIMGSLDQALWDVPYEEQKDLIAESTNRIEACTGQAVKIISSPYMASDINTLKVADELGIPYVTARGTTGSKATVYQVEGYGTKILSVSNIPNVQFEYGSLCDFSFFQRSGTPGDMLQELNWAIQPLSEKEKARYGIHNKVTPVTHTNIGGYLEPWMDMWISFWDDTKDRVEWVNLDSFMAQPDWILPDWQVPINKNAPYTPEKIRPITSYENTEKVKNPCEAEELNINTREEKETQADTENQIVVFHNGQGAMCLEFLDFIDTIDYPVKQHITTDRDFSSQLQTYMNKYDKSEGVSDNFGYYPIIFVGNSAFSGFDEGVKDEILNQISM